VSRLRVDRDTCKGSADTPRGATLRMAETPKLRVGGSAKRFRTARGGGVAASKQKQSLRCFSAESMSDTPL